MVLRAALAFESVETAAHDGTVEPTPIETLLFFMEKSF